MKLIVGLGNPGKKYLSTRHNVGFMVVDRFAKKIGALDWQKTKKFESEIIKMENLILAKPQTFMNSSGEAANKIVRHYKINEEEVWVIHDDLDILLGDYKIQKGKGPREHKGIDSIEKKLGFGDFWRVRIGIENRNQEKISGEKYVLQKFNEEELDILNDKIDEIVEKLISLIEE
jgi:PTH1 family peptidyl-tRNA hydrolase